MKSMNRAKVRVRSRDINVVLLSPSLTLEYTNVHASLTYCMFSFERELDEPGQEGEPELHGELALFDAKPSTAFNPQANATITKRKLSPLIIDDR